jgi:hypothetical protein
MKSPLIELKEETLPALSPEDYADPVAINMRIFRSLQAYLVTGAKPVARLYFLFPRHGGF